jgi:hypothetical protein
MIARAEVYQAAVALLRDLPPYEQCRHIVQMVYDGSLTHEEGLQLLYTLVGYGIDPSVHWSKGGTARDGSGDSHDAAAWRAQRPARSAN